MTAERARPNRRGAWIDGGFVEGDSEWASVTEPYRGAVAAELVTSDAGLVAEAVAAAARARPIISGMPAHERAAIHHRTTCEGLTRYRPGG